jgi:hypothetical protein
VQADQGVLSLQKDPKKQDRVHQQHHDHRVGALLHHGVAGGRGLAFWDLSVGTGLLGQLAHGFLAENDGHGTLHAEAPSQPPHWESAYQPATLFL